MFDFFKKDKIGQPPWDYYFLQNLAEKDYPKYLAKLFYLNTGEKLPLKFDFKQGTQVIDKKMCKTFNQKIQWIKLYGVTDLMRDCTDKVKVRDYVKEKIGEEYLKPVLQIIGACHSENLENQNVNSVDFQVVQNLTKLQEEKMLIQVQHDSPTIDFHLVSTYFDRINWDKLPNSFVIKTNHGCKWHYIIKNKEEYIKNKRLINITKEQITDWLSQDYSFYSGFEMQYKGIKPKILIEPLMRENINKDQSKINIYCFNGIPEIIIKFHDDFNMSVWNYRFEPMEFTGKNLKCEADRIIKQTFDLSKQLAKNFKFVRIDWMIYENKPYFEEFTFTPYSGFFKFVYNKQNIKLGCLMSI